MPALEPDLVPFEEERASLALRHRTRAQRPQRSPLRLCLGLCALGGIALLLGIAWFTVEVARQVYQQFAHPHRAHHVDPALLQSGDAEHLRTLEPTVVRSFFGHNDTGSVEFFNLKAAIWLKTSGKLNDPDALWEKVFEEVILRDVRVDLKAVHAVPRVQLSKAQLALLRLPYTRLQSTFVMLPSPASLDPEVDYHTWRSSRNASMHSIDGPNPPINVDDRDVPAEGVLRSFLANSACWRPLVNREEGEGAPQSNSSDLWITTKSIVTLIDDFPTYNLSALNQSMVERASWKRANCHYGLFGDFPCGRDFTKDGHFENLIEFDDARDGDKTTATKMGWRYSPFLTTTFGYPGPLDHVKVPLEGSTEEDDFSFDWHVSWASLSSFKFHAAGLLGVPLSSNTHPSNWTQFDRAQAQDAADIFHSAAGHSVRGDARPGLRAFVRLVQTSFFLVMLPLDLHYWSTRTLSTGISLPLSVLGDSWGTVLGVLSTVIATTDRDMPWILYLFQALGSLDLLFKVVVLLRLEFTWGGPMSMVPLGVSRRRHTHSERTSARADLEFSWLARFFLIVAATVLYRFGPDLPHLVSADPPTVEESAAQAAKNKLWKTLSPWFNCVWSALGLTADAGQIHLNHRLQSFGGMYRIAAIVSLAFEVLEVGPTLLVSSFGEWHLRTPVTLLHLVKLSTAAALAWQAVRYKAVPQVEQEEE